MLAALMIWAATGQCSAQRVRLGDSFVVPNARMGPPLIGGQPRQVYSPQQVPGQPVLPNLQTPFPAGQPAGVPPGTGAIQQPAFDPFAVQPQLLPPTPVQGTMPGVVVGVPNFGPQPVQPPPFIYPPPATAPPGYAAPGMVPGYPGCGYPGGVPNQGPPNYGYGNGSWSNSPGAWPSEVWARLRGSSVYRLLERPRWRHTWLAGDDATGARGLGLNETDIATTLNLPNFLFSSQPLRLSPGFIFHFWEGPDTAVTTADLPGQTYSTYLASDFSTSWDRQIGAEVNLTVGLYTDFQEVTSDSIRITGLGLGWFRLNNTTTFKVGVEYLDRLSVKLLPAGGFFIYPSPDLKLDLYFPRPKIARRLPNFGNYEVWSYVGAEYGGGSWTIERIGDIGDQVDVNDIRAFVGLEWLGPRQVTGFFEAGYVFDREIIYRSAPNTHINIDDTFMLRAGIAF